MQAVILAAGKGTRLGNITYQIPKPMIKIMGKPILEHNILLCKKFGITKIFINLHHLSGKILDYFGDGSRWGVELIYKYEPELLGTAGAVKNFQEELNGQLFFVIYGDNYSDLNLGDALSLHQEKKGIATIVLTPKEDVSNSGIAVL
ncbi:MAG: NDP-sugar synthase, partial [Calditrichia bacterium]